jgi:hypothetical protein
MIFSLFLKKSKNLHTLRVLANLYLEVQILSVAKYLESDLGSLEFLDLGDNAGRNSRNVKSHDWAILKRLEVYIGLKMKIKA